MKLGALRRAQTSGLTLMLEGKCRTRLRPRAASGRRCWRHWPIEERQSNAAQKVHRSLDCTEFCIRVDIVSGSTPAAYNRLSDLEILVRTSTDTCHAERRPCQRALCANSSLMHRSKSIASSLVKPHTFTKRWPGIALIPVITISFPAAGQAFRDLSRTRNEALDHRAQRSVL